MFRIADGREHFYQWDIDRQIIVEDPTIAQVHFCNRTDDCSLVTEVKDGRADVPNILLQSSYDIRVFGYDGKATLYEKKFKVSARTRPADYVYTETEIRTVQTVVDRANLTLDQTNEALQNTEEALANTETALDNANKAVEIANTANERAEVAISDVERFANEAKESAEQAQAAVVNYYTKEDHATNYSDAKEVFYFDFLSYDYNDTFIDVPEEYKPVFDRLANGEHLTIYIKDNYAYAVADVQVLSDTVLTFRTHYTDALSNKPTTTITEYTASGLFDTWAIKLKSRTVNNFITEIPSEYITESELDAKNYIGYSMALGLVNSLAADVDAELEQCAKKTDIPDVSNFLTEVPEEYITADELRAKDYATETRAGILTRLAKDGTALLIKTLTTNDEISKAYTLEQVVDRLNTEGIIKWAGEVTSISRGSVGLSNEIKDWYSVDATGTATRVASGALTYELRPNAVYVFYRSAIYEFESEEVFRTALRATVTNGIDLTGYATEEYVDNAIANIDIPEGGSGDDSYVLDFSYVKDDYQNCNASMTAFIEAVVNGTVLTSTVVAVKVGNNITPVMVNWSSSTSEITLKPLVSIDHLNNVLYGQYSSQTYATYLINASTKKYKRYNYGYARPESWANTGMGGSSGGDGGWLYTTNRFDSDLYDAKEIYIELVDYEYTGGNCIFSHVVFNSANNEYLGTKNYQPYIFATPHGRDDVTPYWTYNGSWIDIYNMGSYDVTTIAYKK